MGFYSGSSFLLVVIVRVPFLSVAYLKDPFLLCARRMCLLLNLFFGLSTLFYKLIKIFWFWKSIDLFQRLSVFCSHFSFSCQFFRAGFIRLMNVKRHTICVSYIFYVDLILAFHFVLGI